MKLKGKNVLVYGMGSSGQAACKLLHEMGACVSIYDDENKFSSFYSFEKNPTVKKYDLVVVSPGIKVRGNNLISFFLSNRVPVISELDLGFLFCKSKIIGITGTNGKTTVTSLVGEIFKKAGKKTFVCGNIGLPLTAISLQTDSQSFIVCEVSNFQLELSKYFCADLACILNLAPDHLDRHGSFEEYMRVKKKILAKPKKQKIVLNYDDENARNVILSKKVLFFSKKMLNKGVFIKNGAIYFNKTKIISCNDIPLFGEKNLENVLGAVAICCKFKIKPAVIKKAIMQFKAPPHRMEYLGQVGGADVFDDSKATNISACKAAVESLGEKRIVLLIGGQNKDFKFDEIFSAGYDLEQVLCFGQCGQQVFDCASSYGYHPKLFSSMKGAAYFAKENAQPGQKILLAPACASFDEFCSYAVRGEVFKEIMLGVYDKIEMQ